jgi:hypothetical protein
MHTGNKLVKPQKSKFKKDKEKETFKQFRKKHHDKSTYRLMKQEERENVIETFEDED